MSARRLHASSENGQTIVITVLFLGVLIGMAGLVIDVGSWYVTREKAQAAADFGALAAAPKLPNSLAAEAAGEDYVGRNLADATAEVDPAFGGDPSKAEVRARTRGETFYSVLRGLIEGLDVEVNGNGFQMHGTGESTDEELILVE